MHIQVSKYNNLADKGRAPISTILFQRAEEKNNGHENEPTRTCTNFRGLQIEFIAERWAGPTTGQD